MKNPRPALAAAFALALLFLACAFRPVVEGDGVNYFAYLHSIAIDHDLDFSNEYRAAQAAGLSVNDVLVTTRTPTGLLANFQPVGSALLALPFYLVALLRYPGGEPQFGTPFVTAFVVASLLYGLLAVALGFRLAAEATGSRAGAAVAALAAVGASSYLFYLVYEPSYAHTFAAFAVGAFVLAWWRGGHVRSPARWFGLGLLAGLPALVRFQDAPLAAIALIDLPRARWRALPFLPGLALAFAPQLAVDHVVFGSWLPYRPPEFALQPWPGHYLDVLLSTHNGLFTWTPVVLAALIGMALLPDRRLALAALYAFGVELAIQGAAPDWWGGHSFGMRRFLDLFPFLVVGLAELARRLRPTIATVATLLLAGWNFVLVANFLYLIRTDRDPGLLGLLAGQAQGLRFAGRLFAQGGVVRNLLLWQPLHEPFRPVLGLSLLALEAACLGAAVLAATVGLPARRLSGLRPLDPDSP